MKTSDTQRRTDWPRAVMRLSIAFLATSILLVVTGIIHAPLIPYWQRINTLAAPIGVIKVQDGKVTLTDNRVFAPAGIVPAPGITPDQFDQALRVATMQGVEVTRDLGDGRAIMRAEPKFYNWCGTCGERRTRGFYWRGDSVGCDLAQVLILTHYARFDPATTLLKPIERWRLDAMTHVFESELQAGPCFISEPSKAFRYLGSERYMGDDQFLEYVWKVAPPA
ncbi:MAG: hypothetical protein JNL50_03140 [Phycisphaerae bacterium]|nr:hypothetical protein [Phycisphaerae bacterium]